MPSLISIFEWRKMMLKLLKWELKQKFTQKITYAAIVVLCFISLVLMQDIEQSRHSRSFATPYNTDFFVGKWKSYTPSPLAIDSVEAQTVDKLHAIEQEIAGHGNERSYQEINRLKSVFAIATIRYESKESISPSSLAQLKAIWSTVYPEKAYDDEHFHSSAFEEKKVVTEALRAANREHSYVLLATYYERLYRLGIEETFIDELTNVSFLYTYLDKALPGAIFIVTLVCMLGAFSFPLRSGSLKLILQQGGSRAHIYVSKWLATICQVTAILVTPMLVMTVLAVIKGSYVSLRYPVPALRLQWMPIANYFPEITNGSLLSNLTINAIGRTAPANQFSRHMLIHDAVELIPFYRFVVLALVLMVLSVGLIAALSLFISACVSNDIFATAFTSVVFTSGLVLTRPLTQGDKMNLSPFSYINVTHILDGGLNTTFYMSAVILGLSTLVVLYLGGVYFNRKDI